MRDKTPGAPPLPAERRQRGNFAPLRDGKRSPRSAKQQLADVGLDYSPALRPENTIPLPDVQIDCVMEWLRRDPPPENDNH
jgi:hypothetical protein